MKLITANDCDCLTLSWRRTFMSVFMSIMKELKILSFLLSRRNSGSIFRTISKIYHGPFLWKSLIVDSRKLFLQNAPSWIYYRFLETPLCSVNLVGNSVSHDSANGKIYVNSRKIGFAFGTYVNCAQWI